MGPVKYAIVIPACDEAPCLAETLRELIAEKLPGCGIVVGVNGSTDTTAEVARENGAVVAETEVRGYGHGCMAAMREAIRIWPGLDAFVFFSADGSNVPADIRKLLCARKDGMDFVLGSRTRFRDNLRVMGLTHTIANRLLGAACGFLTGRLFSDLGPLRLITVDLMREIDPVELNYGWTIEAQVRASQLEAKILEVEVRERSRRAGMQKVSGVNIWRTIRVGVEIFAAGFRSRIRPFERSPEGSVARKDSSLKLEPRRSDSLRASSATK